MKLHSIAIPAFSALLAAASAGGAVLVLAALYGGGSAGVGPLRLSQFEGYDMAANRLLAGRPTSDAMDASIALTRRALAQAPYDNFSWLRLAYIDSLRPGGLSAQGVAALETSYGLFAVDRQVESGRLRFTLNNWARVSPAVRKAAMVEFDALSHSPRHQPALDASLRTITDPAGIVVATFWLNDLREIRAEQAAKARAARAIR